MLPKAATRHYICTLSVFRVFGVCIFARVFMPCPHLTPTCPIIFFDMPLARCPFSSNALPTTFQRPYRDLPTTFPRLSHDLPLTFPRPSHDHPTTLPTTLPRPPCDLHTTFPPPRPSHNVFTAFPRPPYDLHATFPRPFPRPFPRLVPI